MQKEFSLGPVVGENKKWVLNPLPVALPKRGMGLVFWATVVGDSLSGTEETTYQIFFHSYLILLQGSSWLGVGTELQLICFR